MTFQNLGIILPILNAIKNQGYTSPTPIQQKAIPSILQGRDLIGCAQTGTGKTAAFAIPILQLLENKPAKQPRSIRTLILTPTRELAIQINENFASYGKNLPLKHTAIFGGVSQVNQARVIRSGADILIATPGRLLDLMQQRLVDLSYIEVFVLDEADRMLDMGFVKDVQKIVAKLPKVRQTLFFSATMPISIQRLADSMLNNPAHVIVAPVSSAAQTVEQSVYFVEKEDKNKLLSQVLSDAAISRSLIFTRTKHGADKLVKQLLKEGIFAAAIHGNKSQNARQKALNGFKVNQLRVLVATDIAARGIDIDELPHVINFDLPNIPETYVHRIGRTGRGGNTGTAVSFCGSEEKADLRSIEKLIGFKLPVSPQNIA
jgi:ATP-dependent RNA helicase RhlE